MADWRAASEPHSSARPRRRSSTWGETNISPAVHGSTEGTAREVRLARSGAAVTL